MPKKILTENPNFIFQHAMIFKNLMTEIGLTDDQKAYAISGFMNGACSIVKLISAVKDETLTVDDEDCIITMETMLEFLKEDIEEHQKACANNFDIEELH